MDYRDKLLNLIDRMQRHNFNTVSLKKLYEKKYGVKLYPEIELSAPAVIKRLPNPAMQGFRVGDVCKW